MGRCPTVSPLPLFSQGFSRNGVCVRFPPLPNVTAACRAFASTTKKLRWATRTATVGQPPGVLLQPAQEGVLPWRHAGDAEVRHRHCSCEERGDRGRCVQCGGWGLAETVQVRAECFVTIGVVVLSSRRCTFVPHSASAWRLLCRLIHGGTRGRADEGKWHRPYAKAGRSRFAF